MDHQRELAHADPRVEHAERGERELHRVDDAVPLKVVVREGAGAERVVEDDVDEAREGAGVFRER